MALRQSSRSPESTDRLIPFSEVPDLDIIPRRRRGAKLHSATLYRWTLQGTGGIRLRAVRVGGQWCTRREWLLKFFEDLAAAELGQLRPRTDSAAQVEIEKQLRAAGAM